MVDDGVGPRLCGRPLQRHDIVEVRGRTHADVVGGAELVAVVVLEDDRDLPLPVACVDLGEVASVDDDPAAGGLVEAGEELDERRLARTVESDDRGRSPDDQIEVEPAQDVRGVRGVAKADVPEGKLSFRRSCRSACPQ